MIFWCRAFLNINAALEAPCDVLSVLISLLYMVVRVLLLLELSSDSRRVGPCYSEDEGYFSEVRGWKLLEASLDLGWCYC